MKKLMLLLLMLSIPCAGVAEEFGCMDVISCLTERTGSVPTQLHPYVQPVPLTSEGGALRAQLIDALFVDGAIAVAWTIENTGNEPLYIVNASEIGKTQPITIWHDGSGGILSPGEMRQCGYTGYLRGWQMLGEEAGTHLLTLSIAGLRLLGEPVYWDETVPPAMTEAERIARNDIVDALFEEGKVVIDQYGELQTGHLPKVISIDTNADTPPLAQGLMISGKAAAHSLVTIETPIKMDMPERSIITDVSVSADGFEGEISLGRVALSDARLRVEAFLTFPDEASALAFYNHDDRYTSFPITVMETNGKKDFYGLASIAFVDAHDFIVIAPEYQENGTYVWRFASEYWFITPNENGYRLTVE